MRVLPPAALLIDIEGTATPPGYVEGVLLPHARRNLLPWIAAHLRDADVAAALAEVRAAVPGQREADTLAHWMDQGIPAPPLRRLAGLLWAQAFAEGTLKGALYPDVAPALRRWAVSGLRLFGYSAASQVIQRTILASAAEGDLAALFGGFFDTGVGGRKEPDSYARLAIAMAVPTMEVLHIAADEAALDAAAAAGMRTFRVRRPGVPPADEPRHSEAGDFPALAAALAAPA